MSANQFMSQNKYPLNANLFVDIHS